MSNIAAFTLPKDRLRHLSAALTSFRRVHWKPKAQKVTKPPPPPTPPKPPEKPAPFTFHGETWHDPFSWMSNLQDKVAMRHMDVYMEQEEKYAEAVLSGSDKLQHKLQAEMASRLAYFPSSPPVRWGPWLYYRRVEEGKQYPVLCRRLASLHEELLSYSAPFAGFDYRSGKRIEQKLIDYNQEAERFGGYAYEERSEVSPDHCLLAYTMYNKDKDFFTLSVRNLCDGSLCSKPHADRVSTLAWAMGGKALLYTVTNSDKRPYRIFCCLLGSGKDDVLIYEESDENVHISVRNTKDFQFVTINAFSATYSKVFLIKSEAPLSGMTQVWESEPQVHCIIEHHKGWLYLFTDAAREGVPVDYHYLLRSPIEVSNPKSWELVFQDDAEISIEDVDFCDTHVVLILREGRQFKLCSVPLPLPSDCKGPFMLNDLNPRFLPLPKHVCQISPGPNYDFSSSTMRFVISSPVMPDAIVDYDLRNGKWVIVQQQNVLHERTRTLYGATYTASHMEKSATAKSSDSDTEIDCGGLWNDLSEFYACEQFNVPSKDAILVPLTIVYSRTRKKEGENPGLLHGHGAYGELLDKRWRSELKSLLDRGWVLAYADVRGGGGGGKRWHLDGRRTKKHNSINDYISCAEFLIQKGIVQENKLAGWGYGAGGLLVAAAINSSPDLFRAAVLKVPFLDPCNSLLYPISPITPADYEEFGYPGDFEDFQAIRRCSPYDNIKKGALYPAVMVTASFCSRFGVWEAAKWVAMVRKLTVYDPEHPIFINFSIDMVEENRYLHCKDSALETAFLLKMMSSL